MNATPESIAEKYAADWFTLPPGCRTKGALGAQIESAIAEAIREAIAPAVAERDRTIELLRAECEAWRDYDAALQSGELNLNRHHDAMASARAATDRVGALGRKP